VTRRLAVAVVLAAACTPALHEPPPLARIAPGTAHGRSADQLMHDAEAAWQHRAQPGQAATAQGDYLDAAVADPDRIAAVLGAARAMSYRIEHDPAAPKASLAEQAVEVGQWCQRRAPAEPMCDYRLAIALGQQAREKPSTGKDGVDRMVELLHKVIAAAPTLDAGGAHRVLALVLLRAPPWPTGPGDPEAAVSEARAAVAVAPDDPQNQLALGEALATTAATADARAAYTKALAAATTAHAAGDPDAQDWQVQATAGLKRTQ
jgi:hypothetical protein